MKITAKIIAHSTTGHGGEIISYELCYPRPIHGEVMTHRDFSRNAMSSRAIPVSKMIEQVRNDPWIPTHWGKNQAGMQAGEDLNPVTQTFARQVWLKAAASAADSACELAAMGLHKQITNRLLEPFQWMRTIVTATNWDNFYELRRHADAEPHFQDLANAMWEAREASTPVRRPVGSCWHESGWHLPYVTGGERKMLQPMFLVRVSAARCARVSYLTHDNETPDLEKDLALFDRLVGSRPLHASPIEHQAYATYSPTIASRNFRGWIQHREHFEKELANA